MSKRTILVACLVLAGCSGKPVVTDVSDSGTGDTKQVREMPGVPIRIRTMQTIHIFKFNPETDAYEEVSSPQQNLADPNRLFSVDIVTGLFASPGMHITEYPDNTPKLINTTSTENTSGAIDAVTNALTNVTTAENTKATQRQTLTNTALMADQAVYKAINDCSSLSHSATAEQRGACQQVVESAKRAARIAHANAGSPPPDF